MSFGKRLGRIIKSNINDLLSSAEDPEKQLDLYLTDMEDALRQAKQHLIRALADEKRLRRQLDEADDLTRLWAGKAQQAVDAAKDDLARDALRKKRTYEDLAGEYDTQLAEQQDAVDKLREQYKQLEARLREARDKRRTLQADIYRQRAQGQIEGRRGRARSIDTGSLTEQTAFDKFDEMAGKIEDLEARTEASREIEDYLEPDRELAERIDSETGRRRSGRSRQQSEADLQVDIELEEMRKRAGRAAEQPSEGRRSRRRELEAPADPPAEEPAEKPPADLQRPAPEDDEDDDNGGGWGRRVEL